MQLRVYVSDLGQSDDKTNTTDIDIQFQMIFFMRTT